MTGLFHLESRQGLCMLLPMAEFPSLSKADENSIELTHHLFFIHSPVYGHWRCFQMWAPVNNEA